MNPEFVHAARRVALPEHQGGYATRVDPELVDALARQLPPAALDAQVRRVLRLYFNCDDGDGPQASLADLVATAAQRGWQEVGAAGLASGSVMEDPGYFDVAALGPLPLEPVGDGPCRYLIGTQRVWLDALGDDGELWLCAASPAAHDRLDRALRPRHPRGYEYGPAHRTESWPWDAVVDPTLTGFC